MFNCTVESRSVGFQYTIHYQGKGAILRRENKHLLAENLMKVMANFGFIIITCKEKNHKTKNSSEISPKVATTNTVKTIKRLFLKSVHRFQRLVPQASCNFPRQGFASPNTRGQDANEIQAARAVSCSQLCSTDQFVGSL